MNKWISSKSGIFLVPVLLKQIDLCERYKRMEYIQIKKIGEEEVEDIEWCRTKKKECDNWDP